MPTPFQDTTNQPEKRRPGWPRKDDSGRNQATAGSTDMAAVLARLQQLEAAAASRDSENALLRAELAAARHTPAQEPTGQGIRDSSTGNRNTSRDGNRHVPATDLFNDNHDDHDDPPTSSAQRRHAEDSNDATSARANKRQRLQRLADERHANSGHTMSSTGGSQEPVAHRHDRADSISGRTNTATSVSEKNEVRVPKPKGQAGKDYSLSSKMGLSKSKKALIQYNTLLRNMRDAVSESRIPWQNEWANIPAADKAMLFAMRERDPFLKRFENDWASEAMVRQYLKNKCKRNYQQGTLQVAEKYEYLKDNSAKRDQTKTRKRKAIQERKERKRQEREAKKKAQQNRRRLRRVMQFEEEEGEPEFVEGSSRDGDQSGGQDDIVPEEVSEEPVKEPQCEEEDDNGAGMQGDGSSEE
ncbi:hypothetical protein K435DRAFT_879440 [Dendrothele bispora CBS 962.96]|uniref:Uncharacterized protein n=1 Tax=Dendrothele bispora (strain CBS 962.96) TaxID=1314807 RepID=A0A4S8KM44_DENBC|nr:hypothetical protein K435DRAFT_879440 [Dendrothele bispora CBS 962.96]